MKWITPKAGDKRFKAKFAFLPRQLTLVKSKVWLEKYYSYQVYRDSKWVELGTLNYYKSNYEGEYFR